MKTTTNKTQIWVIIQNYSRSLTGMYEEEKL